LSGRGLCDELITRPEESYRLCCVVVCDLETSRMGAPYIYDVRLLRVNSDLTQPMREVRVIQNSWYIEYSEVTYSVTNKTSVIRT